MSGRVKYWLAALATSGLLTTGLATVAAAPVQAASGSGQFGSSEVGNLLVYANTDFEGTIGNWTPVSNSRLADDTGQAFLHADSLRDAALAKGASSFQLGRGHSAIAVKLPGKKYRLGAYFKAPAVSGQTVQFSVGCAGSPGVRWSKGTVSKLQSTGIWQYSEDDIAVPAGCTNAPGSPRVTLGGLATRATVNMDEVIFAPYRAAVIIGAHGLAGADGHYGYDAQDWADANSKIGPLQSDKEFFQPTQQLPATWNDPKNDCYGIEKILGTSDSASWPVCVISHQYQETEPGLAAFFKAMPPQQMVIMVFHNEVEDDWKEVSGSQFASQFHTQSQNVRAAAAADGLTSRVFVAEDSSDYQYGTLSLNDHGDPRPGQCPYIVPSSDTDFYLVDHYDNNMSGQGSSLPDESGQQGAEWRDWLSCVQSHGKPIGLGEYGFNCKSGSPNDPAVTQAITSDGRYLQSASTWQHEPTIMWAYWYGSNATHPGNSCVFTNPKTIAEWKSLERQNT
jgi:hypothetical protein